MPKSKLFKDRFLSLMHMALRAALDDVGAAPGDPWAWHGPRLYPIRIKLSIDSFRKHDGFVVLTYTLLQYLRGGPSFSRGLGRQTFGSGTDVCEKAA